MKRWGILVRREFWENRALWIAPGIAAVFLVGSSILLALRMDDVQYGPRTGRAACSATARPWAPRRAPRRSR
jgi:hypothetical protein